MGYEDWLTEFANHLLGFLDRIASALEQLVELAKEKDGS